MKIAVLGTGMVGQTIAGKMLELGHETYMGTRNVSLTQSRTEPNQMTGTSFLDWYSSHPGVQLISYAEIPGDIDIIINATSGQASIEALQSVGQEKLKGKTILDIANPLDFSQGFPPTLSVCNTDSLGELIQRTFPEAHVVKSLNTMNTFLMVNPGQLNGDHVVMMSGNEQNAKAQVADLLKSMGWRSHNIIDLGDITTARGTEMILPVWLRLFNALGTPEFNFNIVRN